jgi:PAS domain S-box-containing protein
MKPSGFWKNLAMVASLAAVYFAIGKLGLMFSLMRPSVTPVWPPSGIAVAALLVLGHRVWPGVFLGAFAVELTTPCSLGTAFAVAVGNTLESMVGAWLANRFAGGRNFFERPWDVLKFAVLVGIVSPLLTPPLGVSTLSLDRFIFWGGGGSTWLIWWLGDLASVLVLTPLLIVWLVRPRLKWNRWKTLEFGILVLLLVAVSEAVFGNWAAASARDYLFSYLCLPFLFWAAFRFSERETLTATFVLGVVVMWGTLHGYGLFDRIAPDKALLVYQGFMATTSIMAMVLAAVVGQRRRAGEELLEQSRYARGLIEASLDPLMIISPDGKITDVNRATESITGAGRDRLIGSDFSQYFAEPEKAKEGYGKIRREGQIRDYPLSVRHRSGRTSDVLYNATVLRNESGELQGVLATARDITERISMEQVIRRSEARYRSLVTATAQIIWTTNAEGQIVEVTPTWRQYSGQSFADASGSGWFNVVHPEDREQARALWEEALRTRTPYETECRMRRRDGEYQHFLVRAVPVLESGGNIREWISAGTDITERKRAEGELERHREHLEELVRQRTDQLETVNAELQREIVERKGAEEALRINLTKYSVLFESFPLGISVTDHKGAILETNEAAVRLLGVPIKEHTQRQVDSVEWQIIRPDRTPMPAGEYASVRALKERRRIENQEMGIVKGDNQVTWISVTAEPLPLEGYGVVITYSDITERKRTEEAAQRSEATLRGILDAAKESIWLFSRDGRILMGNATAVERFGDLAGDVIGKHFSEIMPAELASERLARLAEVVESGHPLDFEDERRSIHFHHTFYPVLDADGRVSSVACFSKDITGLRRAEQALLASRERLQLAQQAGRIGTFDRNLHTNETIWNAELEAIYGLPPGGFKGSLTQWEEYINPQDRPMVVEKIRQGIENRSGFNIEFRIRTAGGDVRWIAARGNVVCDEHGQPLRTIGVNMDVTPLKEAQEALQRANAELEQRVAERTEALRQTNRILRMISECNQALVHGSNEPELIRSICRTIHEIGGFRMVWAGWAENDRFRTVRPVAVVGFDADYFQKARISWADNKFGRGPTGKAIRTGKICTAADFLSDPELAPWRKLALQRSFRSSIALPLLAEGRAFGALTIYATEPAAFDENQIRLLTDLADDLSFGITTLRIQAERDRGRKELEQKATQLRNLTAELAQAEERERRRIASVLHDSIQQLLVGARYGVETLRGQSQTEAFQQAMRRVDDLLDRCLKTSRSLTLELSPPILYEAGLAPALKWLGRWFHETHGLRVSVVVADQAFSDTEDIRVALFRAVRELLFNIVKHAKVKRAQVRMSRVGEDRLKILVTDKGAGFEPAKLQVREGMAGGFGLFSLRERLASLGGQMEVESAPGVGSRFTLIVPLGGSQGELVP